MHLVETYSLASGSKIKKPFILDKYFPLPVDRFITLQSNSKYPIKCYDNWTEVINILKPILEKENIEIVQIGGPNDPPIPGCIHTQGATNIGQAAFLIKNGLLHLGVDSFGVHAASCFNKKIVALYSNNHVSCVDPYWTEDKDKILFEPERGALKPVFAAEELPKTINSIKPEPIAEAVCKLLNIEFKYPFETVLFGEHYNFPKMVEMIPSNPIDTNSIQLNSIIVRMDFEFNETVLQNQLSICPCIIITDKPINLELLRQFKDRIQQFIYIIKEDNNPEFALEVKRMVSNFALISYLPSNILDKYKLDYLEVDSIHRKEVLNKEKTIFKDIPTEKLFYKTNKITIKDHGVFQSRAGWKNNQLIQNFQNSFQPFLDIPESYEELAYYHIVKLK